MSTNIILDPNPCLMSWPGPDCSPFGSHDCTREGGHRGRHRCVCGATSTGDAPKGGDVAACRGCGLNLRGDRHDTCEDCYETWPCTCGHHPASHSVGDDEGGPGPCRACRCGGYRPAATYTRLRVVLGGPS